MIDAAFGTVRPALPLRRVGSSRCEYAWAVLETVLDPEVPVVSVVDSASSATSSRRTTRSSSS